MGSFIFFFSLLLFGFCANFSIIILSYALLYNEIEIVAVLSCLSSFLFYFMKHTSTFLCVSPNHFCIKLFTLIILFFFNSTSLLYRWSFSNIPVISCTCSFLILSSYLTPFFCALTLIICRSLTMYPGASIVNLIHHVQHIYDVCHLLFYLTKYKFPALFNTLRINYTFAPHAPISRSPCSAMLHASKPSPPYVVSSLWFFYGCICQMSLSCIFNLYIFLSLNGSFLNKFYNLSL